jgi:hypothetical protein
MKSTMYGTVVVAVALVSGRTRVLLNREILNKNFGVHIFNTTCLESEFIFFDDK